MYTYFFDDAWSFKVKNMVYMYRTHYWSFSITNTAIGIAVVGKIIVWAPDSLGVNTVLNYFLGAYVTCLVIFYIFITLKTRVINFIWSSFIIWIYFPQNSTAMTTCLRQHYRYCYPLDPAWRTLIRRFWAILLDPAINTALDPDAKPEPCLASWLNC